MAKLHWSRILESEAATSLLWRELGHDDPSQLDEGCSINRPYGSNPLITFNYENGQGNPASCGIEMLAGKYLFFGEYCAYEDDAGPFDDFEEGFGAIMDRDTLDVSLVDYNVTSEFTLDETLRFCANHIAEGRTIVINQAIYLMKDGKLGAV